VPGAEEEAPRLGKSRRRAIRSFWVLLAVAVVAAASLEMALKATASPATGVRVALSGIVLASALALDVRILAAIDRARRRRPRP